LGFFDFSWVGAGALPLLKELMSPLYELARTDGDDRPFQGATNAWTVSSMLMTSGYQTALHYKRTAQLIRRDGCDDIVLQLVRLGAVRGDFDGTECKAMAGQILCYDRARPLHVRNDDNASITLAVPRHLIETISAPLDAVHGCVLGGPAGVLLRDHLVSLACLGGQGCDNDAIGSATLSLVAAALGGAGQHERPPTRAVGARVRELIDAKLASEGLCAETICRTAGISRSVLYRQFKEYGGVEKYILERRLSVAHSRLERQPANRISELAFDLGFKNPSHFSTAYRARFGVRPSDTLHGIERPGSSFIAAARVAQWIRITDGLPTSPVQGSRRNYDA
jgi:AraC-like DNA-binding protein